MVLFTIMSAILTSSAPPTVIWEQKRRTVVRRFGKVALGVSVLAVSFLTGELCLRLVFDRFLPSGTPSYESYLSNHFKEGRPDWLLFERYVSDWAMSAKELTPRVVVVLYPHMALTNGAPTVIQPEIADIHTRMLSLCRRNNVPCTDLSSSLAQFDAFDNHPSAEAHRVIAETLHQILREGTVKVSN
ncbi:MAG: hypothetical protein A4E19_05405 [Nitrospira sp. SG-bin1]|nr:MAG: hypothetical protein A4E19_05405 [Nitrospira sp. SG-bin1]